MFTLFRLIPRRELVLQRIPALIVAMATAEALYKFHSFTLECGAFLATWFVIDAAFHGIAYALTKPRAQTAAPG